jgi:hypothetical protein
MSVKHIVQLVVASCLYCNCTLQGIWIIHSCAAAVHYALRWGGGLLSEPVVVLCPYITRILHTIRAPSLRSRGLHSPVDP